MNSRGLTLTEEMKTFLLEGFHNYAAALVALSEFRRQVNVKLETVLDEFSSQFAVLGLPTTGLRPVGSKLEDRELWERSAWIGLKKNYGAELYSGCYVAWDFDLEEGEQLYVAVWIYPGRNRAERNRLFSAVQKLHALTSATVLEQYSDGSTELSAYCDRDAFYNFDTAFRTLLEEWIALLSAVEGGLSQYLPAKATSVPEDAEESGAPTSDIVDLP